MTLGDQKLMLDQTVPLKALFSERDARKQPLTRALTSSGRSNGGEIKPGFAKMPNLNDTPNHQPRMPDVGILLLDESSKLIACDRGASMLLGLIGGTSHAEGAVVALPGEIAEALDLCRRTGKTHWKVQFRVSSTDYVCRGYGLQTPNGCLAQLSFVALHLERVAGSDEAINEAIANYHLTDREQQTLRGILLGLSTKEVADQMRISPNTVKAFTRLIMIKLGVTTRWGIIAKILANRDLPEEGAQSAAASR